MSLFAACALAIAAAGVFGAVVYLVTERRREIGIRLSLGATPTHIVRTFVTQAIRRAGAGLLIGLGAALGLVRYLESILFGVQPMDPWAFAIAAITMISVTAAAALLPARRATTVNPAETLRAE